MGNAIEKFKSKSLEVAFNRIERLNRNALKLGLYFNNSFINYNVEEKTFYIIVQFNS